MIEFRKEYTLHAHPTHKEIEPTEEMIAERVRLKKHQATCLILKAKRKKKKKVKRIR